MTATRRYGTLLLLLSAAYVAVCFVRLWGVW